MLQWTWTSWERVWRSASKQKRHWTSSPPSSFLNIPSWYACRWTKLPSPSGIVTPSLLRKDFITILTVESAYTKSNYLFLMCFQWVREQVRELVIREEHRVAQEQEAACPWLWIPSSPGELKHVQEGFWLQLVEEIQWTIQEQVLMGRVL